MAEYWKSTPKYWCKFCSTFVRDTPIEKKQHEATAKHQNNIQRSLRELHKTQGREERDKQRAKDEIARLNKLVPNKTPAAQPGPSSASAPAPSVAKAKPTFTRAPQVRATAEDRKRQAAQLAAMGVQVPDEFRKDLSQASEWSTVSAVPVYTRPPAEIKAESEDSKEFIHERKRKMEHDEDDDDPADAPEGKRRIWGSSTKAYPGSKAVATDDFDALLSGSKPEVELKTEPEPEVLEGGVTLKKEESLADVPPEGAAATADAPVVFKKRKAKR